MTKNQFILGIDGLTMKLPIRLAMYFHLVHGISQVEVAKAINREASYIADRAKKIRTRAAEKMKELDLVHGEFILPAQMVLELKDTEDRLVKSVSGTRREIDLLAKAKDDLSIDRIMQLKAFACD